MEDVLDQYESAYDPEHPLVCFDETTKQLIEETRNPLPTKPGQVERYDYEYQRNGVCNLFLFFEPLASWRQVQVTERRTSRDFAQAMKWLVDEAYPEAECIRVVLDNLGTHKVAALYEAFPAAEARRIAKRLEFHYTPRHGRWLNMAEIELSVLSRGCLDQRISDKDRRGECLGRRAKPSSCHRPLAVHDRRCANQTQATLSIIFRLTK